MTNAILYNHQRGSGREVTINLIDAGVKIVGAGGEPIAVWPYGAIDLLKHTFQPDEGEFAVQHDDANTLQVFDHASFQAIKKRAPLVGETLRERRLLPTRFISGIPDEGVILVSIMLVLAALGGLFWI